MPSSGWACWPSTGAALLRSIRSGRPGAGGGGRVSLGLEDGRWLSVRLFLDCGTRYFPKLLGLLLPLLARERHGRVRDNICGALARLLMASPTRKPEPQVRQGAGPRSCLLGAGVGAGKGTEQGA